MEGESRLSHLKWKHVSLTPGHTVSCLPHNSCWAAKASPSAEFWNLLCTAAALLPTQSHTHRHGHVLSSICTEAALWPGTPSLSREQPAVTWYPVTGLVGQATHTVASGSNESPTMGCTWAGQQLDTRVEASILCCPPWGGAHTSQHMPSIIRNPSCRDQEQQQ